MSGDQCCSNPPIVDPTYGQGVVVDDFGGLKTYVSGSGDSAAAVVLVSGIFGYEAPNLRKLADKVASAGFYVVVPDFFYGDPLVLGEDIMKQFPAWKEKHGTEKGFDDAKSVVETLKQKGISAIGAAGFCWGAKPVVELAKTNLINAAVLLHPSLITVNDFKEVKCHICILGAEIDRQSPPPMLKECEEILSTKSEVNSFVKIFPGVEHGWTMRYKEDGKAAIEKAEEAHKDMTDWFVKYLNQKQSPSTSDGCEASDGDVVS